MIMTMDAGGVVVLHFLWLVVVVLILVVCTVWSGIAALCNRSTKEPATG